MAFGFRKTFWPARLPGLGRLWPRSRREAPIEVERPPAADWATAAKDAAQEKVDEVASTLVASGAIDSRRDALIALRSAVESALELEGGELEEEPRQLMLAAPPPVEFTARPSPVRRLMMALSGRRIRVRKMH